MITVASHECRTIIGRLDKGADLVDSLIEVCRQRQVRTATVVALGALQSVELAHFDTANKRYGPVRRLIGPLEILSAVGNVSELDGDLTLHLHSTLSREGDNGIEVLGGHVISGEIFACEFSLTALDDVMLRRGQDRSTGLPIWKHGFERDDAGAVGAPVQAMERVSSGSSGAQQAAPTASEPEPEPEPDPDPDPDPDPKKVRASTAKPPKVKPARVRPAKTQPAKEQPSWADVAVASQEAQATTPLERASLPLRPVVAVVDDEDDDPVEEPDYLEVEPGDIVEHPKFKRCKVARVEGDMEYVQVRLTNGNLVRLSLDIVRLVLVGSEGGHQVFKAIIDG